MLTIGCHLSKRRGYLEMAKEAASINTNTFQYFTRSPRGSEQAALDEKDVAAYLAFAKEHGIHDALAYAPYVSSSHITLMPSASPTARSGHNVLLFLSMNGFASV